MVVFDPYGIDPRFDSLSGKLNYDLYRKSYKWIEEKQENEAKELQQQMFNEGDDSEKRRIQVLFADSSFDF